MSSSRPNRTAIRDAVSFTRGLEVLAALSKHGPVRVNVIAETAGLPLSTTYRYVRALLNAGFLEQLGRTYMPGPRLLWLASRTGHVEHLQRLAEPILHDLVDRTEETAILTVRAGTRALVVDRVESPRPIRLSFERGAFRPLHAGASAKVLLAYTPESIVAQVSAGGITSLKPRAPTEMGLRRQLAEIRASGYAVTAGEVDPHAIGVAMPVFLDRVPVGALASLGRK